MRIIIDIEANRLENPDKIWLIVCKDIDTHEYTIFRNVTDDETEQARFLRYSSSISQLIGHNILGYDVPVLSSLLNWSCPSIDRILDTLIVSKLYDYSRVNGHSIEDYGLEFGLSKINFVDFSRYSKELEEYCIRDVDITHKVYLKYLDFINDPSNRSALDLEHRFQLVVNDLSNNGFSFNTTKANELLNQVTSDLSILDKDILDTFPPREVLVREFTPKATKFGTISLSTVPKALRHKIHEYEAGQTYRYTKLEPFNPASHKQIIEVLNEAGWSPENKTQTHIELERLISRLERNCEPVPQEVLDKHKHLKVYGWKVDEKNLSTLPADAPAPARLLAKRILLESRRRTLTEWLALCGPNGRIHGKFYGIGAWTHRMAHQSPNTANIPREFHEDGTPKLLGKEMRSLWNAPKNRLLVGVDAEGIQLRIFAHYINDQEFTNALVNGKKSNKTDPHSLNQRILGDACKSRQAAKRFVYALLLGAGLVKLSQILQCERERAQEALNRLLERYQGFAKLKSEQIPEDARRGYFIGIDGRKVRIPSDTESGRRHLCMSGYLQNGEAIVIKKAACLIDEYLCNEKLTKDWMFVDIVHDELQSEVKNDMKLALRVAEIKAKAIEEAGNYYNLRCPMAGSYWNDDHKDYTIGVNWYQTH